MKAELKIAALAFFAVGPAFAQDAAVPQLKKGEAVYRHWCVACHGIGPGHPGTQALAFTRNDPAYPDALELRADLDPHAIEYFVRNGTSIMPFFRKTEVSDAELAAIVAWLTRNNPK